MEKGKASSCSKSMSGQDVYPRLNNLEPGFLKKDVTRYEKENGLRSKALELFKNY